MERRLAAMFSTAAMLVAAYGAHGTPPVIWRVGGAMVEMRGFDSEVIQHEQFNNQGASFSWDEQMPWSQHVTTGQLSGFTEQHVEIASRGGAANASTLTAGQYQEWSYVHAGGFPNFAFRGLNQLGIEAFVLGPPGTSCMFEIASTTTWPQNGTPSGLEVIGWATPANAFEWGNEGNSFSQAIHSTDPVLVHEGRSYSRVWIRPTSDLMDVYQNSGQFRGPYIVNGGLRHDLTVTVTHTGLCAADVDQDGVVNSQDFFAFLTSFFAGGAEADFNHDSAVNSQDLFDFLTALFAGC